MLKANPRAAGQAAKPAGGGPSRSGVTASSGNGTRPVRVTMGGGGGNRHDRQLAGHDLRARAGETVIAMQKSLDRKLAAIHADPNGREFILADAKDADMALGLGRPGNRPRCTPARSASRRCKSIATRCV